MAGLTPGDLTVFQNSTITLNKPQFIDKANGIIAQELNGDIQYSNDDWKVLDCFISPWRPPRRTRQARHRAGCGAGASWQRAGLPHRRRCERRAAGQAHRRREGPKGGGHGRRGQSSKAGKPPTTWRPERRPKLFPTPGGRSISTRRRRASMRRSPPRSVLRSGWCGSGRTTSASRPTRSRACPAPTSARPSAPTSWAASPTCCRPSRAIRRCCSISTTRRRWARTRSPASIAPAASTRTSRAKSWSCIRWACAPATPRTTSSASPRCSPAGPSCPAGDNPEHGGEFIVQSAPARARTADGPRQGLRGHRRRAGPRRAARPGRASGDRQARRHQARALLHCRRAARRRWSRGWRRPSATPTGDLKEVTKALVASPEAWTLPRTKLKRPSEWVDLHGARGRHRPGRRCPLHRRPGDPRRALVAPALAQGLRRRRGHLDRRHGPAPGRRQQLRGARGRPHRSAVRHGHGARVDRFAPRRRRRSPAPRAGSRRWPCCSCRPSSRGGEPWLSCPICRAAARR